MAKKLSLQIKLEGGKEIKRELAEMGEEGKKAFYEINKAAKQVGGFDKLEPAKLAQVNSELKKIGVSAAEIDKVSDAVNRATRTERLVATVKAIEGGFENLTSTVKLAALAFGPMGIAIAVVAEKAFAMVSALTGGTEAINKAGEAAAKAGLSLQKYSKIQEAIGKGGVSPTGAGGIIQKISEAVDAAKIEKVAAAVKKLQEVMAQGSDPRTSSALQELTKMAQGFGPVADAAKKALADLNIQFTAQEQKLQEMASSGTQSLQQLASGLNGTAVEGRAFASALQQLAVGNDAAAQTTLAFIRQLESIKDPVERNNFAFQRMGADGLEMAKAIQTGALSSKKFLDELGNSAGGLDTKFEDLAAQMQQSMNRSATAMEEFKTKGDLKALGTVVTEFFNQMNIASEQTALKFGPLLSKFGELIVAAGGTVWDTFASSGSSAISRVSGALDGLIAKLQEAVRLTSLMSGGGIPSAVPSGYASGGLIGGGGTGTSDSNLAWVSRGEHIMPARAVAQPGVLALLEALRRSGGNLSQVLNGLGRYAAGGLVMPSLPKGSVGGTNHVTIQFPGLSPITGLRASSQVVDELRRSAAMAQVRSGGRKPSRYT